MLKRRAGAAANGRAAAISPGDGRDLPRRNSACSPQTAPRASAVCGAARGRRVTAGRSVFCGQCAGRSSAWL